MSVLRMCCMQMGSEIFDFLREFIIYIYIIRKLFEYVRIAVVDL